MTEKSPTRAALTLGALGIVYGDIGTSPLYALRECFLGASGFPVDRANIFGILSLITWALITVISLKYLMLVLRADNQGQGGILALSHLLVPDAVEDWRPRHWLTVSVGLFGASLLFGDGIITPALSVLSAVEGLQVAAPALQPLVTPLAVGILAGLFAMQRFGTARVGQLFGPIALIWFVVLGLLGLRQIATHPEVLAALSPTHAWLFFRSHGIHGTLILGAVFLAVTGGEALYADLGHFGRAPIRRSWFSIVFPCLLLNYFGQGALLLESPELVENVFYRMSPSWALYPLVFLATLATIIASQAVISGVFSLTAQAVQLGYFPRTRIHHTSSTQYGQIYVPTANGFLFVGTLALVLWFGSSGALADAYGIAVSLDMTITTVLLFFVMTRLWRWPLGIAAVLTLAMLAIDLSFLSAIARKILNGGWIPLTIAVVVVAVMGVWRRGRQLVSRDRAGRPPEVPIEGAGTVVFLVREAQQLRTWPEAPGRPTFILHVNQCHRPYMDGNRHAEVTSTGQRVEIRACYGYLESPDIPALLEELDRTHDLGIAPDFTTYVVLKERLDDAHPGMARWMKFLYRLLAARALPVPSMFKLPPEQVVEVDQPVSYYSPKE